MKCSLALMRDSLREWTLARSDRQFEYLVYGGIALIAGMAVTLSYIGATSILAFVPVIVALLSFGGYLAQGYEWRQQRGLSRECVEREDRSAL